jgi:hypothetical protein
MPISLKLTAKAFTTWAYRLDDLEGAIARYKNLGYGVVQSGAWGDVGKKDSGQYGYMATDAIGGVTVELIHAYK